MPIAKIQMSDGRVARFEVADGTTPEDAIAQATAFFEKEGPTVSTNPNTGRTRIGEAAKMLRPAIETTGAIAGGIIGAPLGIPGALAGSGLGYAGAKQAADIAERYFTGQAPPPLPEQFAGAAEDIGIGATMEAGGQLVGAAMPVLINETGSALFRGIPTELTAKGAEKIAANAILKRMGTDQKYNTNELAAQAIQKEIPGFHATLGEQRQAPALISLQRSLERGGLEGAGNTALERRGGNVEAINNYLAQNFSAPQNIDNVFAMARGKESAVAESLAKAESAAKLATQQLPATYPQALGEELKTAIQEAHTPVKQIMTELESEIPSYQMEFPSTAAAFDSALTNAKLSAQDRAAIDAAKKTIAGMMRQSGPNTHTAMGIRRTLRNMAGEDPQLQYSLNPIIEAVDKDLQGVSEIIKSGDVGIVNGKPVNLEALADDLYNIQVKQKQLANKSAPDWEKMRDELIASGRPGLQLAGETKDGYLHWLQKDYQKFINPAVPMKIDPESAAKAAKLQDHAKALLTQLNQAKPGADVAAQIRAFNKFAREEHFGRFGRESISNVTAQGNKTAGALRSENIPAQFATPSGADELINAIGQERAKELMQLYFGDEILNGPYNPTTGEIGKKALDNWLYKRREVLQKYGLQDAFKDIESTTTALESAKTAQDQFSKSILAKLLNADPQHAISQIMGGAEGATAKNTGLIMRKMLDAIGDNNAAKEGLKNAVKDYIKDKIETTAFTIGQDAVMSAAKIENILKNSDAALKILYADSPKQYEALQMVRHAVRTANRSSAAPIGGGSDTSQLMAESILNKLASWSSKIPAVSFPMRVLQNYVIKPLEDMTEQETKQIIFRALYDPDYAYSLIAKLKAKDFAPAIKSETGWGLLTKSAAGGIVSNNAMNKQQEPQNNLTR